MKLAFFVRQLTLILGLEKELNNWFDHSLFQKICLGISPTSFFFFLYTGFYFKYGPLAQLCYATSLQRWNQISFHYNLFYNYMSYFICIMLTSYYIDSVRLGICLYIF